MPGRLERAIPATLRTALHAIPAAVLALLVQGLAPLAADAQATPPDTLDGSQHDLILLVSGEWLQGEIESIRDGTVFLDSVELEDLQIDLDDVAQIITERPQTLRFEGNRDILTGPVLMVDDRFEVGGETRPRDLFMTMNPASQSEFDHWNGMVSVGYSIRAGNTDQSDLSVLSQLNRETALTRFMNTYNAAFSTGNNDAGENTTTANSHRLNSAFEYYVSNDLYLITPAFEVFADEFQNIDLRLTPSAGLGYDAVSLAKLSWSVSAGAGYQYTDLVSVQGTGGTKSSNAAVIFGTALETDPTSRIEWDTNYTAQVIATQIGLTNHHLTSLLSVDLIGSFDLDVTFNWDAVQQPVPESDGTIPKKNDYRLTVGLGFDF